MNEGYKMSEQQSEGDFNIRTMLDVLRYQWYWFALSVLLCLGVAYFYNHTTMPQYKQKATVLIKSEERTENAFIEKQLFDGVNSNLANEKLLLQSRLLMMEVVTRLGLDIEYTERDGLRKRVLYPNIPIRVSFKDECLYGNFFSVTSLSDETFLLDDFSTDAEWVAEGKFGKEMDTPAGRLTITQTGHFGDNLIGHTVEVHRSPLERLAASMIGNLLVDNETGDATLLAVTYQDSNAKRADAIIRTLIEVYNDDAMRDKNQILFNTALFIDERLQVINGDLASVDGDIEQYKKVNKLTNVSSEASLYLQNNDRNRQEVVMLTNQQELVQLIKTYLNDPAKQAELLPANSGIMDTGVEGMIVQYNDDMLMRNKLMRNSSDRSPAVEDLNNNLSALRTSILYSLTNLHRSLQIKREEARRQEELSLGRIGTVPTQERYILSVERQQKIKEELYLYLLNKREENALSMATVESKARMIDPPFAESVASGMGLLVLLVAGVLAGMAIPSVFFYLQPLLDVTVRGRRDLKEALSIPFLGEIPRKKQSKGLIVVNKEERDGVSEAFRVLRSNLDYVLHDRKGVPVIMFTSANANSGKTFLSSNLAVSLAMTGKRVMLLEMDIRKGSGRKRDGSVCPGISNYLSGRVTDWTELIARNDLYPNLDIIHSGPVPPNPAELLLLPALDELVDRLKETYDIILIDTVPYGMMADAQIINRVTDITIYVIREGLMDRRMLPDVETMFTDQKLNGMCVVLNDSVHKHAGYGYGYGYYGYAYGYGYGYKYGGKKRKKK